MDSIANYVKVKCSKPCPRSDSSRCCWSALTRHRSIESVTDTATDTKPTGKTTEFFRDSFAAVGNTRIIDAVLMFMFVLRDDLLGIGFTVNDLAGVALVGISMFRRPERSLEGARWFPVICICIVAYLGIVAVLTGPTDADATRLVRIVTMMLLAGFIASGRIDIVSGLKGFGVGLAVNIPLFYAGIAPRPYGSLLTGYLTDKNVAGLTYAVMTVLLLLIVKRTWVKILLVAAGGGAVVLTDSRTSMAALAAGIIWLLIARHLGPFFRICLAALLYWAFLYIETNFAQAGQYADRSGSDALRERIDAASLDKVLAAPWYGHGLGEATTEVAGDRWFFHNSYWGLLAEGGYPLLLAFLALIAFAGFQFMAKGKSTLDARIVEAAAVVTLLCASRLGEVFITQPSFIMIGLGMAIALRRHDTWKTEQHQLLVSAPAVELAFRSRRPANSQ